MTTRHNHDPAGEPDLVVRANEARSKLLHTIEALEARGKDALRIEREIVRHKVAIAAAGAVVALALGAALFVFAIEVVRGVRAIVRR